MKKRIFSRVLALVMALSLLSATALADVSFDQMQSVIDGTDAGTQIENTDNYGHFWQGTEGEGFWGVESSKGENNSLDITLNTDVTHTESDENSTITVGEDQNVNLDLNDNNITGDGEHDVIDVKGDLTITGADSETPEDGTHNTISGGATGIDVGSGGSLTLDGVTVTGNGIGVAFVDPLSVTFIGDQNVVNNNTAKNIDGSGKVNFKLTDKDGKEVTYKVDAKTAETLLTDKGNVVAHGHNSVYPSSTWILIKNSGGETYTAICTGTKDNGVMSWIDVNGILNSAAKAADCKVSDVTRFVIPNEVKTIADGAFKNKTALEEINLPENLTTIEITAFEGCTNLRGDFVFPKTLKSIGFSAFFKCESLTSISFSEGCELTTIPGRAFYKCTGLTAVNLPNGVTDIGGEAFYDCSNLEKATLPEGLKTIGRTAFIRTKLSEVTIPSSVTSIGDRAFAHCTELKSIEIPKGLKTIEEYTFYNCSGLTGTLTLPEGLTTLGTNAFGKTSGLTSVAFPSTLTKVDAGAFSESGIKSAIHYLAEDKTVSDVSDAVAGMKNAPCNLYVVDGNESLTFYRGDVSAALNCNSADAVISLEDGSVAPIIVSGTITVNGTEVPLPDETTVSIDTEGNITVHAPITVDGTEYPHGASIAPDGTIEALPAPPVPEEPDTGVVIMPDFFPDTTVADDGTTITDEEIPLAGLISRAQLVSYLYIHEGSPDGEDAEGEYTMAMAWAVAKEIVGEEDDPDEIVTVAILREVMTNYAAYLDTTFAVVIEGEDDMIVMNCDEILAEFYASLEAKAA